ncbi:HAMP domain-containing sensor histidine kinase [Sporolactobacillus sp. Y61]|jgi:signal transduction histidine kinase|uniref:histidine kinase n=1 Tax=Sporolactobacillus sp. Y61 TaxID=3160863 RepID=A0AAU8IEY3_9BACL|nr:HAMP domain-containing sensor histidine kinase [Sporolactobacillus sp. THM19-2]RYL92455.1 HAMP domain-containing histidine kinase [Sporolactobacillus sp. THM19-2]
MKLKTRIQVLTTGLVLITLLVTNLAIYLLFYTMTVHGEQDRVARQAGNIMITLNAENAAQVDPEHLIRGYLPEDGMIRLVTRAAKVKIAAATDSSYNRVPTVFHDRETKRTEEIGGKLSVIASVPMIWRDGSIVSLEVIQNIDAIRRNMNLLKIVLALTSLIILIPILFTTQMLSRLILNPIHAMIRTMEKIQQGDQMQKIKWKNKSKDELQQLADTFNRMIDRLEHSFEKQKQFVSDASHELKTPLTVVESYAALLKRWGREKPDVLDEAIQAIHSEALRMKSLIGQMLLLAQSDDEWTLDVTRVDIIRLADETGRQMGKVYDRHIRTISTFTSLPCDMDVAKIRQLLVILLDNAIKYSKESITIRIGTDDNSLEIRVEDRGTGIPEKDQEKVFDRFFRVDKVRSRETGGSGLGLAIARHIVSAHKGRMKLQSVEGIGTCVIVLLPLHRELNK